MYDYKPEHFRFHRIQPPSLRELPFTEDEPTESSDRWVGVILAVVGLVLLLYTQVSCGDL